MDHILVMPVTSLKIAVSKILGNALVITVAVGLSLTLMVRQSLGIPIAGSMPLFMAGVAIYLFFAMSVGIFFATIARTMSQLGLLYASVDHALALPVLSSVATSRHDVAHAGRHSAQFAVGAHTPLESMPYMLRMVTEVSLSTHFVSFAQAILYRGAGLDMVWSEFVKAALISALFLGLDLVRYDKVMSQSVMGSASLCPVRMPRPDLQLRR